MDARTRHCVLSLAGGGGLLVALFALSAPATASQQADSLPPGVTRAMVERGRKLFQGEGLCIACHGMEAKGGLGPDLTDDAWLHHDGSYAALVRQILQGIDQQASKTGQIMPPRGGSSLNEKDIQAVAAYVWTLSRPARR